MDNNNKNNNNNNNNNNNKNNKNNNNNSIEKLFFLIWRNKYLKFQIINHIKLFNKYCKFTITSNFKEIENFKYKDYITELYIIFTECIEPKLYPIHLKKLFFSNVGILKVGYVPNGVETLELGANFKMTFLENDSKIFPSSLKSLTISTHMEIRKNSLPESIENLKLENYSLIEQGSIPSNVKEFTLGSFSILNKEKSLFIPNKVEKLTFNRGGSIFPSIHFPESVTEILFKDFNLPLRDKKNGRLTFPRNLKSLSLGDSFRNPILPGDLPRELENLDLGDSFNGYLKVGSIPDSVTKLSFGQAFNKPIKGLLPKNLKELTIYDSIQRQILPGSIPNSVEKLSLYGLKSNKKGIIPPNVKELILETNFGQDYNDTKIIFKEQYKSNQDNNYLNCQLSPGFLPNSIESLQLFGIGNIEIKKGVIPNNVKKLSLPNQFNQNIQIGLIPKQVVEIKFGMHFNKKLSIDVLPSTLKSLSFGRMYDQPIESFSIPNNIKQSVFPSSLTFLKFDYFFNQILSPGMLPNGLKEIHLGQKFDKQLLPQSIPLSCIKLSISNIYYSHSIDIDVLDLSITSLRVGEKFIEELPFKLGSNNFNQSDSEDSYSEDYTDDNDYDEYDDDYDFDYIEYRNRYFYGIYDNSD